MVRVFLLSSKGVFGQGVECLLRRQTEIEILGHATDIDAGIDQICDLKPVAVVVADGDVDHDPAMVMARIAVCGVEAKVIGLDLNSNTLTLYRPERYHISQVEDLVALIRADPKPN